MNNTSCPAPTGHDVIAGLTGNHYDMNCIIDKGLGLR